MSVLLALLAGLLLAGGGALAWSVASPKSIPDNNGVYTGCYVTAAPLKSVLLIDPSTGAHCPAGFTQFTFNQAGQAGPPGPSGPAGPAGTGIATVYRAQSPNANLTYQSGSTQDILSLTVPAGSYVVTGRAEAVNGSNVLYGGVPTTVTCYLHNPNAPFDQWQRQSIVLAPYDVNNLVGNDAQFDVSADITVTSSTTIQLTCGNFVAVSVGTGNGLLTAIPVGAFAP